MPRKTLTTPIGSSPPLVSRKVWREISSSERLQVLEQPALPKARQAQSAKAAGAGFCIVRDGRRWYGIYRRIFRQECPQRSRASRCGRWSAIFSIPHISTKAELLQKKAQGHIALGRSRFGPPHWFRRGSLSWNFGRHDVIMARRVLD